MNKFSQNFVKTALCGVVGSERFFRRAGGQIYGKGYPFPMLATKLLTLSDKEKSLPHKVLRLMEQKNSEKDVEE